MLFELTSAKPIEALDAALQEAAARHKFGVLMVHDLKATLNKKGFEYSPETRVYEVCQPAQAQKVLTTTPGLSSLLPCRISIYEKEGQRVLSTILPTALMQQFGGDALADVARAVETDLVAMMKEAVS